MATQKKAYSYIRFSTPEQKLGDSERRQVDAAEDFCKRQKLHLQKSIVDEGKSGFKGTHRTNGNLGEFLKLVKTGAIEKGSFLIVESVDRLGREGASKMLREVIFELFDYGITIQTLSPMETYEPGCENEPKFIAFLLYMQRAYDESLQKSVRIKAARDNEKELARTHKRILTTNCPAWLRVVGDANAGRKTRQDRRFELIPEAAKTIQTIFDMKLLGHGVRTIVQKLNVEDSSWKPPLKTKRQKDLGANEWRHSYVSKILHNPATIGIHQPHKFAIDKKTGERKRVPDGEPIADYFPAVVDEKVFLAVQAMRPKQAKGGRNGKHKNLFKHLGRCPYCGGSMTFVDKGPRPKGGQYLRCERGSRTDACQPRSIRYDEVESLILENCPQLAPEQIIGADSENLLKAKRLRTTIAGLGRKYEDNEKRIDNLVNQVSETESASLKTRFQRKAEKLEIEQNEIKLELDSSERELASLESSRSNAKEWQDGLAKLKSELAKGDPKIRERTRNHIARFIDRIELFTHGYGTEANEPLERQRATSMRKKKTRNGKMLAIPKIETLPQAKDDLRFQLLDVFAEHSPELLQTKKLRQFLNETMKQRLSKKGRFVRVFFKSGLWIDLVPEGSLASGSKLLKRSRGQKGGKFLTTFPELNELWNKNA